jgi:hypothetical protein
VDGREGKKKLARAAAGGEGIRAPERKEQRRRMSRFSPRTYV